VSSIEKLIDCPALVALKVISGKWKTRILWLLRERPHHFGEIRAVLPGVSAKVLTEQLRQLQAEGVIEAHQRPEAGVTYVMYRYSAYGETLIPALDLLGHWGLEHRNKE